MKLLIISCLLLACGLSRASVIPASTGVAAIQGPALIPVAGSHQFVARNYNGFYVPTTAAAWPAWTPYPNTYYKYSGGYPTYSYPSFSYPYGYYPSYNYGYGYKSVW
ncbi:uncharacterized protein LOC115769791 [Drosophila novamexicana]|uniref:uncharacterized protein LOC115769791 n=1 Tax=Drosophila novamexicana TaxID=47314 RepID=UPI0011E5CF3B|nr:uncharacterized protein LOC115769791 [Drosophila novamexicana]